MTAPGILQFSVDKIISLPYSSVKSNKKDLLIKSGGGIGPVKPQQPARYGRQVLNPAERRR
jgi:hypothetical protein